MSAERYRSGENLAIEKAEALAQEKGLTLTRLEWVNKWPAELAILEAGTADKNAEARFPMEWLQDLPGGRYAFGLDAELRVLIRSLR
jgi:hypothetical protein